MTCFVRNSNPVSDTGNLSAILLRWLIGLAIAALFATQCAAAPSAEVFGDLPKAEFASISPGGKYLAVIKPIDGREKVVFVDLTIPNSKPYVLGMIGALASEVIWKTDSQAICVFHANLKQKGSKAIDSSSRAMTVNVDTQVATLMMYNAPSFAVNANEGRIADIAAGDPAHVYMTEWDAWDGVFMDDFFRVDLATGQAELVQHGDFKTIQFLGDGSGHLLGRIEQDDSLTRHVFLGNNDLLDYSVKGGADLQLEGLIDSGEFAVKKTAPSGMLGLFRWSASGFGAPLFENPNYDMQSVLIDPKNQRVIGVTYVDDIARVKYFDPAMQKVQDALEAAYPGRTVSILSKDDAGSKYVFLTDGPQSPPEYSLYTPATHQTQVVEQAYPDIKNTDLGPVRAYPYKARDGLDIHAYLTLPPGKVAKNLPTVIYVHGGPEDRDQIQFDWWAQFMASRGYAVLQPNFRGSSGYGWPFIKAGDGEWGGAVQHDVQDGVAKLIADGISDPKRICIVGASYGGYMALAGATFSPDLYACAVSYAGMSDLSRDLYTGTMFDSEVDTVWARRIGADRHDTVRLDAISPAKHVDQVKIPILLIHSDRDVTVKIEQSEIENDALKKAGKQSEFITLDGDDHYLELASARIQLLKAIEAFLDKNIGH